jgi:hypothetical protein
MTACTIRVMRGRKKMKKFVGIIVATVLAKRYLDNVLYGIDDSRLVYPE